VDFLVESFQDERGLNWVMREHFVVLSEYNEFPIAKSAWRAAIQPKYKVAMAMILDATTIEEGKCADPFCVGQVEFAADVFWSIW
jgi:hypothetical protein